MSSKGTAAAVSLMGLIVGCRGMGSPEDTDTATRPDPHECIESTPTTGGASDTGSSGPDAWPETVPSPTTVLTGDASWHHLGRALLVADLLPGGGGELLVGDGPFDDPPYPKDAVHLVSEAGGELPDISQWVWEQEAYHEEFGESMTAGDVDADGAIDLLIGATSAGFGVQGRVYLHRGPFDLEHMPDTAHADAVIEGIPTLGIGHPAIAGDVLGFGRTMIAAGGSRISDNINPKIGEVGIFDGNVTGVIAWTEAAAVIRGEVEADLFGVRVRGGRDITGDGAPDLLLSASQANPTVYLIQGGGPLPATASDSYTTLRLPESSFTVQEIVGDVNGDGHHDFGAGVPSTNAYTPAGRDGVAWLVLGPPPEGEHAMADVGIRFDPERTYDNLGQELLGPGDLDLDGIDDLVLTAPGDVHTDTRSQGVVYLLRGPVNGPVDLADADLFIVGECVGDTFGWAVAAGPLDDDGLPDLVISAYNAFGPYPSRGKVYIYLGATFGW